MTTTRRRRAKLKHVLLDVDFHEKPKTLAMMYRFGCQSAHAFIAFLMHLSRATDAVVDDAVFLALATRVGVEEPEALLAWCLDQEMLHRLPSGCLSQERVAADQESLAHKQDYWAEQKRVLRASTPESSEMSIGTSTGTPTRTPEESLNSEDLNIGSKKMDTPEVRERLALFRTRLREQGRELTQSMLDVWVMTYGSRGPAAFADALEYSASLTKNLNLRDRPPAVATSSRGPARDGPDPAESAWRAVCAAAKHFGKHTWHSQHRAIGARERQAAEAVGWPNIAEGARDAKQRFRSEYQRAGDEPGKGCK